MKKQNKYIVGLLFLAVIIIAVVVFRARAIGFSTIIINPKIPIKEHNIISGENFIIDNVIGGRLTVTGCSMDYNCVNVFEINNIKILDFTQTKCDSSESNKVDIPNSYDRSTYDSEFIIDKSVTTGKSTWFVSKCGVNFNKSLVIYEEVECNNNNHCINEILLKQGKCINNKCDYNETITITTTENAINNWQKYLIPTAIMILIVSIIIYAIKKK